MLSLRVPGAFSASDLLALIRAHEPKSLVDHRRRGAILLKLCEVPLLFLARDHAEHLGEHVVLEIRYCATHLVDGFRRARPPAARDLVESPFFVWRQLQRLERSGNAIGLHDFASASRHASARRASFLEGRSQPRAIYGGACDTTYDEGEQQQADCPNLGWRNHVWVYPLIVPLR